MSPVAAKEFRDALRNHWLHGYAGLLAILGLVAAITAMNSSAGLAMQTFGRTTASLTNLCLLLAPLVALTLGAASIAGERDRGTLERLLAQPMDRGELLRAKYFGLLLSLVLATAVGFLPAGIALAIFSGPMLVVRYLVFPALACLVIAALLGLGFYISVKSKSAGQAQARAVFLWFLFVMLYDLMLMGTLMASRLSPAVLAILLVINPVSAGRLLVVLSLEADLYLLGPAGAWLVDTLGRGGAAIVLLASLIAWAVVTVILALRAFGVSPPSINGPRGVNLSKLFRLLRPRVGRTRQPTLERVRNP